MFKIRKKNLKPGFLPGNCFKGLSGSKPAFFMKVKTLAILAVFLFSVFLPSGFFLKNLNAQQGGPQGEVPYDFVLVIDESGSMKNNDPQNMRKDAAKLFFYLAETFSKGNRIMVSGFGKQTNVYLDMADITGSEKEISAAIDKIQSNQALTDMKLALQTIKQKLDERNQQKKTMVIFLTDGSLTLADIPPEEQSEERTERDTDKPGSPDDGQNPVEIDRKSASSGADSGKGRDLETAEKPGQKDDYLENYKKELTDLCYEYKKSQIIINPIAFTGEADIGILQQMADITGGVCYRPEKDTDLKVSFIEILKNLSDRFTKFENQDSSVKLTGNFTVSADMSSLFIVSFKNNYSEPSVKLTDPRTGSGSYHSYVDEKIFKIVKLDEMVKGDWKYEIGGDAIFIYDIADFDVEQPRYPAYLSGAVVPLKIDIRTLSQNSGGSLDSMKLFKVFAEVENPVGFVTQLGEDKFVNFAQSYMADFTGASEPGYYSIDYNIMHIPSGAVAGKQVSFEIVNLPVKVELLEPLQESYVLGEDIKVVASLEKKPAAGENVNLADYLLTFNVSGSKGMVVKDIILLDNGTGADLTAGDGLYSAFYKNTVFDDSYKIDIFISKNTVNFPQVCTGLSAEFNIAEGSPVNDKESGTTAVQKEITSSEDSGNKETASDALSGTGVKLSKTSIIIIASAGAAVFVLLAVIIFLLVYFLYIKPSRLKK
jgi:hypothetical protein